MAEGDGTAQPIDQRGKFGSSSLRDLALSVSKGDRSARDVVGECLESIAATDPQVQAYVRTFPEVALEQAEALDRRVERGEIVGPLAGIPVALKDNIAVQGQPLSSGSRILEGYVSPYSATAVSKLVQAGAIPVGHTNMDEFGMGSSCENSAFFPTRNPWNLERVPGGSSGGSAAAVASGSVGFSLGSDTGGSIRQPAALCGVVGLKPTYGRVSRYGLVAFASSLDQIGPLTHRVEDAALVLGALAGSDRKDATSSTVPPERYSSTLEDGLRGIRVGIVNQFEEESQAAGIAPAVRENWTKTLNGLAEAGAEVVKVDIPSVRAAIATYYVLANSEASANLARFDGIRYGHRADARALDDLYQESRSGGFGAEVKRRILLGTFALSSGYYDAYYGKAEAVAAQLSLEISKALSACDVLLTPTSPTSAFRLGERTDDPLSMYLSDVFTTPASLAGLPAIAVPSGVDDDGLPLSVQFIGPAFAESLILGCAGHLEEMVGILRPPLSGIRGENG